jgi:hypothetical protein
MKKFFAVLAICLFLCSCGASLENLSAGVDDLKACGTQCGIDIAVDALSCPLNGGSYKDLVDSEVQKGLALDAAQCVLRCLENGSVDVLSGICK